MQSDIGWTVQHYRRALRSSVRNFCKEIAAWRRYWASYHRYLELGGEKIIPERFHRYPCLGDDVSLTEIDPIYYYQDAWAFDKVFLQRPALHVDVGSHHKFVALLSKVVPVVMVDIRPLSVTLDTLEFKEGSILELPFESDSLESVSSICVVEHIGLGRYGDPLDVEGTEKAVAELRRVVRPGGNLYISVPLDDQDCVYFNAHRAFREETVMKMFSPLEIVEKRYIYGSTFGPVQGSGFGTGCYHFRKPS